MHNSLIFSIFAYIEIIIIFTNLITKIMTKVYLVSMHECDENGSVKDNGKTIIDEVFTNKKLAITYVNWMNKTSWQNKKEWYWTWDERTICKTDYRYRVSY